MTEFRVVYCNIIEEYQLWANDGGDVHLAMARMSVLFEEVKKSNGYYELMRKGLLIGIVHDLDLERMMAEAKQKAIKEIEEQGK